MRARIKSVYSSPYSEKKLTTAHDYMYNKNTYYTFKKFSDEHNFDYYAVELGSGLGFFIENLDTSLYDTEIYQALLEANLDE